MTGGDMSLLQIKLPPKFPSYRPPLSSLCRPLTIDTHTMGEVIRSRLNMVYDAAALAEFGRKSV